MFSRGKNLPTPILAVLACLLWATAFVGVKNGLHFMPPLRFAGLRFMIAGLILFPLYRSDTPLLTTIHKNIHQILFVAFFQTFALYATFFIGLTMIQGALAAIVIGASPLMATLVAHVVLQNDRMTIRKTVILCVGFCGIIIISLGRKPWAGPTGARELLGIGLLLFGTLSSSLGNVAVARHKRKSHPIALNASQLLIGGVMLFGVSIIFEGTPVISLQPQFLISLSWLVFISSAGFTIWFYLLQRPGVMMSELNVWKFIIPAAGAIISWILIPGESPDTASIIGMICVAASIALLNWQRK